MIRRYFGETLTLAATGSIGWPQIRTIPPGMNVLEIDPFHATTVEALLLAFGPRVARVLFYDASAADGQRFLDVTEVLKDRNTATSAALSSMTTSDYLYVCLAKSARGLSIDVGSANAIATTMTGAYLAAADAWTSLSVTDGTTTGGATFAQDGLVTWTVPAPGLWPSRTLPSSLRPPDDIKNLKGFWVRLSVSDTMTNPTTILDLAALANVNINTVSARSEGQDRVRIMSHNAARPMDRFAFDEQEYGSIELTSTSLGTAVNLNWYEEH